MWLKYREVIDQALDDQMHHVPLQHQSLADSHTPPLEVGSSKLGDEANPEVPAQGASTGDSGSIADEYCGVQRYRVWWRVKILKFPGPDSCERQAKIPEEVEPGQFSAVQCRVTPRDDEYE